MKIPTPEERAKALLHIERQTSREVAKCFSDLVDRVISRLGAFPEGSPLTPGENPAFARMLDNELTRFSCELEEANERGVTRAWTLSDHYGNIDMRGYLKRTGATALLSRYTLGTKEAQTAHRAEAVRAFLDRRDRKGFTISGRVWRMAEQAMQHIETSLSEGLAEGRSAAELSRTIRQDLREPDRLFRRVRDKNGNLQLSRSARAYHPGTGVYRSSYKNALRLTRTEINVSYAEADFERWQRLDFVIGYEVRLSNNHTCNGHPFTDICDELAGKYPKWFKFTKWHPQCRCVCLAIFDDDPGAGEVRDVPPNFKQWVTDNQPRLDRSIKKGTAPYWVRDNFSKEGKLTGAGRKPATPRTSGGGSKPPKPPVTTTTAPADPDEDRRRRTLERAKARHEARTPEEVQEIKANWDDWKKWRQTLQRIWTINDKSVSEQAQKQGRGKIGSQRRKPVPPILFNKVRRLKRPLSEERIIKMISGGDLTGGSCSSVAFAYAGCMDGLKVKDFRGGESLKFFSHGYNIRRIAETTKNAVIETSFNGFTAANAALKNVKEGKRYYFTAGEHAAIVRKNNGVLEFLELQDPDPNGNKFIKLDREKLKGRFAVKQSRVRFRMKLEQSSFLIDIDDLKGSEGFRKLLGYINTEHKYQLKSRFGSIK